MKWIKVWGPSSQAVNLKTYIKLEKEAFVYMKEVKKLYFLKIWFFEEGNCLLRKYLN